MAREAGKETGFVSKFALERTSLFYHVFRFTEHFLDLLAAAVDNVRNNEDLSAAVPIAVTITAQPGAARTLSWVITHAQITALTIVFVGTNAKGDTVTQTFTAGGAVWSGETSEAFARITSITVTARTGTGAGDLLDVGLGSKVGLANPLHDASSVLKIVKNHLDMLPAAYTVEAVYDTVDLSTGGGIVANDDFTITYRANILQEDIPA